MGRAEDILFGKIAVSRKFITPEQLAECVAAQAMAAAPTPLGRIMQEKGFISGAQLDEVLSSQRTTLNQIEPVTRRKREDLLFGKIAVQQGYATQEEVNTCVRAQMEEEEHGGTLRSLGEVMVERGCLTASQVHRILASQKKVMMVCISCKTRFNVVTTRDPGGLTCPKCKGHLMPAQTVGGFLRQDETIYITGSGILPAVSPAAGTSGGEPPSRPLKPVGETTRSVIPPAPPATSDGPTLRIPPAPGKTGGGTSAVRKGAAGAGAPPPAPPAPPTPASPPAAAPAPAAVATPPKVLCPICDHPFPGAPDPAGWVKCPECNTSFVPKER